jgi:hypothetical protein
MKGHWIIAWLPRYAGENGSHLTASVSLYIISSVSHDLIISSAAE